MLKLVNKNSRGRDLRRGLSFSYYFSREGDYKPKDLIDEYDFSKLMGFSACFFPRIRKYKNYYTKNALTRLFKVFGYSFIIAHHWSSYRIASRVLNKKREFAAYIYEDGIRTIKQICTSDYPVYIKAEIKIEKHCIKFNIINHVVFAPTEKTKKAKYKLGFYHGGTISATSSYYFFVDLNR